MKLDPNAPAWPTPSEAIEAIDLAIELLTDEMEDWKTDPEIVLRNHRVLQLEYAISKLAELNREAKP